MARPFADSVLSTRGGRPVPFNLSPDELSQMQRLWEGMPELSASGIAAQFGVTKSTVIGHRYRKGWAMRKLPTKEPSTVFTRVAALHAMMDKVKAETRPFVEDRERSSSPM